jgi:hypothetical protein
MAAAQSQAMNKPTHTFPFTPLPGIHPFSTNTSCCKNLSSKNLSSYGVHESVFGANQQNAPKYFVRFEVCCEVCQVTNSSYPSNFSKVPDFGKVV